MAEGAVPEVRQNELRGIEEFMTAKVVVDRPARFLHRRQGVVIGMCHRCPSEIMGEEFGRGEALVWLPPVMQGVFSLNGSDRVRSCVRPSVVAASLAAGRYGDLRIRSRTR